MFEIQKYLHIHTCTCMHTHSKNIKILVEWKATDSVQWSSIWGETRRKGNPWEGEFRKFYLRFYFWSWVVGIRHLFYFVVPCFISEKSLLQWKRPGGNTKGWAWIFLSVGLIGSVGLSFPSMWQMELGLAVEDVQGRDKCICLAVSVLPVMAVMAHLDC